MKHKDIEFVNLTPHTINVVLEDGKELEIKSSGTARVNEVSEAVGDVAGINLVKMTYGEVEGIPTQVDGTVYIVSRMVLDAVRGTRNDVVAPDTGKTAVRDEKGLVKAVRNFVV